jgi:hypothetical protein
VNSLQLCEKVQNRKTTRICGYEMIEPQDSVFLKPWQGGKLHINCAHFVDNFGAIPTQLNRAGAWQVSAYFGA